jgi:hypothetical protein
MSTRCFVVAAAFALAGCAETCPPPQDALGSKVFDVFGRVTSLEQEPAPEWPAEDFPFNGLHQWRIDWGSNSAESAMTVVIDEQVSEEGHGYFDDVECGNLSVAFKGEYLADDGAQYLYAANGRLIVWPDGLDGFLDVQSSWETAGGTIGSTNGTVQLSTPAATVDADAG